MSKFRIEHRGSKINLVLLKTNIEDTISNDIDLLVNWSNNDRKYVVNELLRFALTQEEDFQKYKTTLVPGKGSTASSAKATLAPAKSEIEAATKPAPSTIPVTARG